MTRFFRFTAFRLSLVVTLGMVLLYYGAAQTGLERTLEAKTLDLRFRWRGVRSPGPQVVLVVVDDASIAELGRWPWSRRRFAALVRRLKAAGARVIAFNMLFTEPERSAAHDELHALMESFEALHLPGQKPGLDAFYQTLVTLTEGADADREFAQSIGRPARSRWPTPSSLLRRSTQAWPAPGHLRPFSLARPTAPFSMPVLPPRRRCREPWVSLPQ